MTIATDTTIDGLTDTMRLALKGAAEESLKRRHSEMRLPRWTYEATRRGLEKRGLVAEPERVSIGGNYETIVRLTGRGAGVAEKLAFGARESYEALLAQANAEDEAERERYDEARKADAKRWAELSAAFDGITFTEFEYGKGRVERDLGERVREVFGPRGLRPSGWMIPTEALAAVAERILEGGDA